MQGEEGFGDPGRDVYVSAFRSRSSDQTYNAVDHDLTDAMYDAERAALRYVADHDLETTTVQIGEGRDYTHHIAAHPDAAPVIDRMETLYPAVTDDDADFITYLLPNWDGDTFFEGQGEPDPLVLVYPDKGVTFVLGSDYTGEAKKAGLRNVMWDVKQDGGMPLHAGCRVVETADDAAYEAFAGLSGTGKTTLVNTPPTNGVAHVVQDDVISILPDGSVAGTEPGMYAKTFDLDQDDPLYDAIMHPDTRWDNVTVADGVPDFADDTLTRNGRAAVPRHAASGVADTIDIPELDRFYHITRNDLMPPVARLTPEQSAAFFGLGESMETGAGDPDRIGESVRVFGYNPFVIGSRGAEVERFHTMLDQHDIESYILNTGYVGGPEQDIGVAETQAILDGIIEDEIPWTTDPVTDLDIPEAVPGMDIDAYDPQRHAPNFADAWQDLTAERAAWLDRYDIPDDIQDAISS